VVRSRSRARRKDVLTPTLIFFERTPYHCGSLFYTSEDWPQGEMLGEGGSLSFDHIYLTIQRVKQCSALYDMNK